MNTGTIVKYDNREFVAIDGEGCKGCNFIGIPCGDFCGQVELLTDDGDTCSYVVWKEVQWKNERHPHADIIIAYVNGETIQLQRPNGDWHDFKIMPGDQLPQFPATCNYRIKPKVEVKKFQRYVWTDNDTVGLTKIPGSDLGSDLDFNVEFEFHDDVLVKATVLK